MTNTETNDNVQTLHGSCHCGAVKFAVQADPAQGYPFASPWLAMASNPLVLEFLLGCLLAWAYARWRHLLTPSIALAMLATGCAAFALSLPLVGPDFSLAGRGVPAGDVRHRRAQPLRRIEAVEPPARRRQMRVGQMDEGEGRHRASPGGCAQAWNTAPPGRRSGRWRLPPPAR